MQLCYVDESGKAETLEASKPDQQPVMVIAGVTLPEQNLTGLTHDWIELKRAFQPGLAQKGQRGWLDAILTEVKGTSLRKGYQLGASNRKRKHATGFIGGTLSLLEKHDARVVGRVWVKAINAQNDDMKMHSSSLQWICAAFHAGLGSDERGMVIVDSQTYQHNHRLAHSVFTQRFGLIPRHERLVDMPVFGHSDNHAGLQIADLLSSALLAPIASSVYAGTYAGWNRHCDSGYLDLREEFGSRMEGLTYDWVNPKSGRECKSLVVDDPVGKRPTSLLYRPDGRSTATVVLRPKRRSKKSAGPFRSHHVVIETRPSALPASARDA